MKAPKQIIIKRMPNTGRYLALVEREDRLLWPKVISQEDYNAIMTGQPVQL
jgi:hypothetical protein